MKEESERTIAGCGDHDFETGALFVGFDFPADALGDGFVVNVEGAAVVAERFAGFVVFVEFFCFTAEEHAAAGFFEDEDDEDEEDCDGDGVHVEDPSEVVSP